MYVHVDSLFFFPHSNCYIPCFCILFENISCINWYYPTKKCAANRRKSKILEANDIKVVHLIDVLETYVETTIISVKY